VISKLNNNTVWTLVNDISKEFENKATVSVDVTIDPPADLQFQSAFEPNRNQWNSPKLSDWLFKKFKPNKDTEILVISDIDSYSDGLNFVFGEAFHKGRWAEVYLPRLRQGFYGLKPIDELF
jgi:archaemetzincin